MTNTIDSLPFLASPDRDHSWRDAANCKTTPTQWFYDSAHIAQVKKICADCPSRMECCDFAVRNGIRFGLWGGLTHKEREQVVR